MNDQLGECPASSPLSSHCSTAPDIQNITKHLLRRGLVQLLTATAASILRKIHNKTTDFY